MVLGNREHHFVLPNLVEREPGVGIPETDKSDLDLAIKYLFNNACRIADPKYWLYPRILPNKFAELLRQKIFAGDITPADPKFSAECSLKLFNCGYGFPFQGQQVFGFLLQKEPQRSQANLSGNPIK